MTIETNIEVTLMLLTKYMNSKEDCFFKNLYKFDIIKKTEINKIWICREFTEV
jgi:hypothetical protein